MSTLRDKIFTVLAESYPNPVHYREVTSRLLEDGAWEQLPKTPENTVSNRITSDISRNGADSQFVRVGNKGSGLYTVNSQYMSSYNTFGMWAYIKNSLMSSTLRYFFYASIVVAVAYAISRIM